MFDFYSDEHIWETDNFTFKAKDNDTNQSLQHKDDIKDGQGKQTKQQQISKLQGIISGFLVEGTLEKTRNDKQSLKQTVQQVCDDHQVFKPLASPNDSALDGIMFLRGTLMGVTFDGNTLSDQ